jgi:GH35 family endo-1,4-beta-xylanase
VINGAAVNLAMYEHEYQWGSEINERIYAADSSGVKYGAAVSALFNSAVLENGHKWVFFETSPAETKKQYDTAVSLGIQHIRGHALMWDRSFPGGWESNSSTPRALYDLLQAKNKAGLDTMIKNHFLAITGAYKDKLADWDVVNELLANHAIRDEYGDGVLKDWYAWAREGAGSGTKLFINETEILGLATTEANSAANIGKFKTVLNYMRANNVDFDGIGIQGHFLKRTVSPEDFYNMLEGFKEYNKTLKVTEFDMDSPGSSAANRTYEAAFVRDILIAAFSQENTNGFLMWGFWSGNHWRSNAPVFNADWSLKESGIQYIDLVYNKWRTRTRGTTDAEGSCALRGFYGDYDITVSANGKTKTVEARCYKGQDNTITVVLD